MVRKYFKRITIFLTITVVLFLSISAIINIRPLSVPISTSDKTKLSLKRFVLVPGKYCMDIEFDKKEISYYKLEAIFAPENCMKAYRENIPCEKYEQNLIKWSVKNRKVEISGLRDSTQMSGGIGTNSVFLAPVELTVGFNEFNIEIVKGLSFLKDLSVKLVLNPGQGAKSSQSSVTDLILLISVLMLYGVGPVVVIFWIIYFATVRV